MRMDTAAKAFVTALGLFGLACSGSPPASQFPDAQAAIDRMRGTYECLHGVRGEAKIDHMNDKGRIRGNLMFFAVEPQMVRFDVVSPFGVTLATLTSDGSRFTMNDLREKKFLEGPASPCNIARLTQVPIPGHALVSLLHGEAPVLVHDPAGLSMRWTSEGFLSKRSFYEIVVRSKNDAKETIHLAPHPDDYAKPWGDQRVRVTFVEVEQKGIVLYKADLHDHKDAEMAGPIIDEDNIDPPVPPNGPQCKVEIPRRIHVSVPGTDDDVRFAYTETKLNPPLPEGIFTQPMPGGVQRIVVGPCDR